MRTNDIRRLTKDIVVMFKGHQCLLHPCNDVVYLLSGLKQFDGSSCRDFSQYRSQYPYSFWLVEKDDGGFNNRYAEICKQLVPCSLGGL